MFGHRWEPGEATIVLSHVRSTSGDGMVTIREYVADVRGPDCAAFRATLQEPRIAIDFWPPSIGDVVGVLVDAKDGSVRFDKDDPRNSATARQAEQRHRFEQAAAAQPGWVPPGPVAPPAPFGSSPGPFPSSPEQRAPTRPDTVA